ncbi:hypothetical protein [Enterococcus rivorum]|uniref:Uncharacterized protein n=1 Tax=Enterococcus rivorum TaxID=762845 RepID=A0A1E5L0C0_9ENTE|nr:hypothetical protein [Enterococcus rivorum]MBP2098825.1 hypothetical protein [Enterococcus rivorum]OEH83557.1 hypothetical protein BCR26_08745 [Enterococcus rivorum]
MIQPKFIHYSLNNNYFKIKYYDVIPAFTIETISILLDTHNFLGVDLSKNISIVYSLNEHNTCSLKVHWDNKVEIIDSDNFLLVGRDQNNKLIPLDPIGEYEVALFLKSITVEVTPT